VAPAGVAITVEGSARVPVGQAFRAIAPVPLEEIFTGYGPLPAVVRTREQSGRWDHVGATRVVELADGSEAREEITSYDEPSHFGYRLGGFTGVLRHLVSHADGAWWFTEPEAGTASIRWTYTFEPRPARATVVRVAIGPLWRRYARQTLALAIARAEQADPRREPYGAGGS
jgi:Polyketide cyclase / dehydrase and lipid transport